MCTLKSVAMFLLFLLGANKLVLVESAACVGFYVHIITAFVLFL